MSCGQVSCSVLPEHFLHVGSVKIRLIDEVFEVNGLEVYCLKLRKLINFSRGRSGGCHGACLLEFSHFNIDINRYSQ